MQYCNAMGIHRVFNLKIFIQSSCQILSGRLAPDRSSVDRAQKLGGTRKSDGRSEDAALEAFGELIERERRRRNGNRKQQLCSAQGRGDSRHDVASVHVVIGNAGGGDSISAA